jgi:hypothetical protein
VIGSLVLNGKPHSDRRPGIPKEVTQPSEAPKQTLISEATLSNGVLNYDRCRACPDGWSRLPTEEKCLWLRRQPHAELFLHMSTHERLELLFAFPESERQLWLLLLPPDDLTDLLQAAGGSREILAAQLDDATRLQVTALLAYKRISLVG